MQHRGMGVTDNALKTAVKGAVGPRWPRARWGLWLGGLVVLWIVVGIGVARSHMLTQSLSLNTNDIDMQAAAPAAIARIDLTVNEVDFELTKVTAESQVGAEVIADPQSRNQGWMIRAPATDDWSALTVTFVPTGSGVVRALFLGGYYPDLAEDHHSVWLDSVSLSRSEIFNPGFEMMDVNGHPLGWTFTGDGPELISQDRVVVLDGQVSVMVWHDQRAETMFEVDVDREYTLTAHFRRVDRVR